MNLDFIMSAFLVYFEQEIRFLKQFMICNIGCFLFLDEFWRQFSN
jgi:hypothetical protein